MLGHENLRQKLLSFYDASRRDLPWRGSRDPYAVWVSEMMLQQTRVSTVLRYFPNWMRRFPDIHSLARADEADVLHAWQGLGYYSRARSLKRAAETVVTRHAGQLPSDPALLRALPGVGAYSAGAIASIAFGRREPIVDGNVIRVLTRLFALAGDPSRGALKRELWALAAKLVPAERPGDFNQALMELGATVCTPRSPACSECPLRAACRARRHGEVERFPELPRRAKPTRVRAAAALIRTERGVLVTQLEDTAPRWAGLWTFPYAELEDGESAERAAARAVLESAGRSVSVGERIQVAAYTITRFRFELEVFCATLSGANSRRRAARAAFVDPSALEALAMPAPHRRLARGLFPERRPT